MFSTVREAMITGLAVSKLLETRCQIMKESILNDAVELSKRVKLDENLAKARDQFWEETDMTEIRRKAVDEAIRINNKINDELQAFKSKLNNTPNEPDNKGEGI